MKKQLLIFIRIIILICLLSLIAFIIIERFHYYQTINETKNSEIVESYGS